MSKRFRYKGQTIKLDFSEKWTELVKDYFHNRFGVDPTFWEPYKIFNRGDELWVASFSLVPEGVRIVKAGLRLLRVKGNPKPTTVALQWLNKHISKNVVYTDIETLSKLLNGAIIHVSNFPKTTTDGEKGYVALAFQNLIIGCGHISSGGMVKSQIPAGKARELKEILIRLSSKDLS
ncbi:MAG: hypothetical protein GXO48_00635 [Chlorobi bacterium]|nr:hypothetical protein [Chlorobiota bacterium]